MIGKPRSLHSGDEEEEEGMITFFLNVLHLLFFCIFLGFFCWLVYWCCNTAKGQVIKVLKKDSVGCILGIERLE